MGKTLYKFRAINDYTNNIFLENKFWYASVQSLNDPNEGMIKEITEKAALDFIRKIKENQLYGFAWLVVGRMPPDEKEKIISILAKMDSLDRKYRYMRGYYINNFGRRLSKPETFLDSINKVIKNAGILSLSTNPLNTLMWSHYADNHRGIAIGISDFDSMLYKPVTYVKETDIPEMDLEKFLGKIDMYNDHNTYEITFDDPSIQKVLTTKTDAWEYECEWRGLKEKFGLHQIEGEISEIIFGLNCEQSSREVIRQIIKKSNHHVCFKEVRRKNYELYIQDYQ